MDEDRIRIFGIRHHGPGCARSLSLALEDWQPDCILLEGPPEGESVLSGVRFIDRGYESMEKLFSSLGAKITRERVPE